MQRVRYLKVLMWAMPERAQQIGAIVCRNVVAVMWERLRTGSRTPIWSTTAVSRELMRG
jgi:hypothetical protein